MKPTLYQLLTCKCRMTEARKKKRSQLVTLILITAFMIGSAIIGYSGKVEAYELTTTNMGANFTEIGTGNKSIDGNTAREDERTKQDVRKTELGRIEENSLCSLDTVTCPDEVKGTIREISAYNSVSEQTDASPCISADGTDICQRYQKGECIVATNAYPLKTKLRIDKIGDCTVADRMNARYTNRVDVFMDKDIERAVNFGVQKLNVIEL